MTKEYFDISSIHNSYTEHPDSPTVCSRKRGECRKISPKEFIVNFIFRQKKESHFFNTLKRQIAIDAGIKDHRHTKRIWNRLEQAKKISFSIDQKTNFFDLAKVKNAFREEIHYAGPGVQSPQPSLFAHLYKSETSIEESRMPSEHDLVKKFISFLLNDAGFPQLPQKWRVCKAILYNLDPVFMKSFRDELQHCLLNSLAEAQKSHLDPSKNDLHRIFIGNIISLLPYSYPKGDITIPRFVEGKWIKALYSIEKIPLNPSWLASPLYAYGLTSHTAGASSLLIYTGTTFPAGDGFAASVLTDFTPGFSVGESIFALGKSNIAKWLADKTNVSVFGQSLGGSLALLTLIDFKDKIQQVDAYNPAGLYPWKWKEKYQECTVNIYMQSHDIVPLVGCWPSGEGVHVYKIHRNDGRNPNWLTSHVQAFTGYPEVLLEKLDPVQENKKIARIVLTFLHMILGPIIVFIPGACLLAFKRLYNFIANFIKKIAA